MATGMAYTNLGTTMANYGNLEYTRILSYRGKILLGMIMDSYMGNIITQIAN
jgi:hypothetical protein